MSEEFVNPVPEPRGERARRSGMKLAAGLVGTLSLLALLRIAWTATEVIHFADTTVHTIGKVHVPRASNDSTADGVSNLPGGYAKLTYAPGPGMFEYFKRTDDGGAYGGSDWGVATADQTFVELGHYTLALTLYNPMREVVKQADQKERENWPGEKVEGPVAITMGGRKGWKWTTDHSDGSQSQIFWVYGDVHSFRINCRARPDDRVMQGVCREAVQSVRFSR